MNVETLTWAQLPQFENQEVIIFGTDKPALDLAKHIMEKYPAIKIRAFMSNGCEYEKILGHDSFSLAKARKMGLIDNGIILVANSQPVPSVNHLLADNPAQIAIVSTQLYNLFHSQSPIGAAVRAEKSVTPFFIERGTPRISALVSNAYVSGGLMGSNIFELADFERHQYVTWSFPAPACPLSLNEFAQKVPLRALPMLMSHLSYLLWKRGTHVTQLSPSRRWFVGVRYNYFFLDILNTETGELVHWHDLPASEGLWDYVATGDFDGDKDEFLFVRWRVSDAIQGMIDETNMVRCQVCRLDLSTMKNTILNEFDFQDRIHQCTISGDGRYMVFAPMRVLRPKGSLKKLPQAEIMRNLQETVVLDSMATLDLMTGKSWQTEIPYPIPAHFELDPFDPHLFYVSTHSLLAHAEGVLCFQPGTLEKMRILDGKTVLEGEYTHPGFIRTTQHAVFSLDGKVYIAVTNQNKVEIVDAATMKTWKVFRIADDPFYDNADFSDPEFLKKPFNLPVQPDWCDSISASSDGNYLILHMKDGFSLLDVREMKIAGRVSYRHTSQPAFTTTHGRYWMQNAPQALIDESYARWRQGSSTI